MGDKKKGRGEGPGKGKGKGKGEGEGEGHPRDGRIYIAPPTDGAHAELLADMARAYTRGDMRQARQQARTVVTGDPTDREREFADLILQRTANDPLALVIGLGTLAMFFVMIYMTL